MIFFPRSPGVRAAGVLIILLVLSWIGFSPAYRVIGWMERSLIGPIFRVVSSWTSTDEAIENARLRAVIRTLVRDEQSRIERVQQDEAGSTLRAWAERHKEQQLEFATVITQVREDNRLLLVIDRGEREGVRTGQAVIAHDGFLVGRIARTAQEHSLVELVLAPGHRFSVRFENEVAALGLAEGRGEQDMIRVGFIPRDMSIALGDSAVTSGMDDRIPKNLLVGTVQEIRVDESGPWKRVSLLPLLRPSDITIVGVLTDVSL